MTTRIETDQEIGRLMLSEAKQIADQVRQGKGAGFSNAQLWTAFRRLVRTEKNGGVRNSERAMRVLDARTEALSAEIKRRGLMENLGN